MADTLVGTASIFGADGTVTIADASVALGSEGAEFTYDADVAELKDPDGDVITMSAYNPRRNITLTLYFSDATGVAVPAPMTKITTASFALADCNGDWNLMPGGKVTVTNEGFAKMTLPCRRVGAGLLSTPA